MAKKSTLAAGTSPFAHLLGGAAALAGRTLGRRAEEQDDGTAEEGDENDADAEEQDEDTPEKGKRGRKAKGENDDDDADAEEEDDDEADAEEEDAEEPEGKKAASPFQRGFAAANKRARAIFASPAAAGRPDLAAQLAFGTRMSAAEAIGVLGTASSGAPKPRGRLDDRMGNRTEARPGADGDARGGGGKTSFADRLAAARKKAGRA